MNEAQEFRIKSDLVKFFRENFTYVGLSEEEKEDRIFKLVNNAFIIFLRHTTLKSKKLPT